MDKTRKYLPQPRVSPANVLNPELSEKFARDYVVISLERARGGGGTPEAKVTVESLPPSPGPNPSENLVDPVVVTAPRECKEKHDRPKKNVEACSREEGESHSGGIHCKAESKTETSRTPHPLNLVSITKELVPVWLVYLKDIPADAGERFWDPLSDVLMSNVMSATRFKQGTKFFQFKKHKKEGVQMLNTEHYSVVTSDGLHQTQKFLAVFRHIFDNHREIIPLSNLTKIHRVFSLLYLIVERDKSLYSREDYRGVSPRHPEIFLSVLEAKVDTGDEVFKRLMTERFNEAFNK